MDPVTGFRVVLTVLTFLIFIGIVWWAYGRGRSRRFDVAALSVLRDDDAPDCAIADGRRAK